MTPKELSEMSTHVRNSTPHELTARGPDGTLPWLAIVDYREGGVRDVGGVTKRSTILVWARDEEEVTRVLNGLHPEPRTGSDPRDHKLRALHVVDPTQNLNQQRIALHITLP